MGKIRYEVLSATAAGMTRLRTKGAANPNTLYELTNGYISADKSSIQRPGTTWKYNFADTQSSFTSATANTIANFGTLSFVIAPTTWGWVVGNRVRATSTQFPAIWMEGVVQSVNHTTSTITILMDTKAGAGAFSSWNMGNPANSANTGKTRGLVAFKGVLYTFTHDTAYTATSSASFIIIVLRHPTSSVATVAKIHFGQPFMGLLYVVAEFSDGFVGHYWLQNPPVWVGLATHNANDIIQPTVANGFYYQCVQLQNPPAWTPLLQYAIGDIVQPTKYNGLFFKVQSEFGPGTPPARSGSSEPIWQTNILKPTLEFSSSSPPPTPAAPPTQPSPIPPGTSGQGAGGGGRYDNRYGTPPRQF